MTSFFGPKLYRSRSRIQNRDRYWCWSRKNFAVWVLDKSVLTTALVRSAITHGTECWGYSFVRSYESSSLLLSYHTIAEHLRWVLLASLSSRWATQRVNCSAPMENKRKMYFPRHDDAMPVREANPGTEHFDHQPDVRQVGD